MFYYDFVCFMESYFVIDVRKKNATSIICFYKTAYRSVG